MNPEFIERHSRQLILNGWTLNLQKKISNTSVLVPKNQFLILYLKALGVNKIFTDQHESVNPDYVFLINNSSQKKNNIQNFNIGKFETIEKGDSFEIDVEIKTNSNLNQSWKLNKTQFVCQEDLIGTYLSHKFSEIIKSTGT
jgi:hypothetical protein